MTAPDPIDPDSILDEKAAEWLFERDEGFGPGRQEAFVRWCNEDPRHHEAVVRVQQALALLDELPEVRVPLEARVSSISYPPASAAAGIPVRFRGWAWISGLAAALVLGFAAWRTYLPSFPPAEHYSADAAAQRSLMLPDGSVLDLNTGSEVSVRFTAGERRLVLDRGEAHFQVAHDPTRPFTVTAGGVTVRAVGTAFNVRLAGQGVDVLVVEGKVELGQAAIPSSAPFGHGVPQLVAGERTQLEQPSQAVSPRIEKLTPHDVDALLTWENPLTSFADIPLRDVVARFNRRNATQLILADADLGDRRIGGMIALDQVDAFVRLLEQDGDIIVDRTSAAKIALRHAR